MRKQIVTLLITAPALALAACGDNDTVSTTTTNDLAMTDGMTGTDYAAPGANDAMMADAAALPADQFIATAAASDAYEIAAGELAQEKATTQELRDFGQQMVRDHTTSTENLKQAAGEAGMTVGAPEMSQEQRDNLEALRNATGEAFDTEYRTQQLAAHEKALSMLRAYAQGGDVAQIKSFASNTAPVVEGHLNMLRGN